MWRSLCASKGFQQPASVGNGGPGCVQPKSQLPRLSGASKRICNPTAPACAALSVHRPWSAQAWLQEGQRKSSCSVSFFSWQPHGHTCIWPVFQPKPCQAGGLVKKAHLRACKKILNRMGQVSLHLVFARDGSVNQSRGTKTPLLSRWLLKQKLGAKAPKRAYPSHRCA